jgi:hypothetical protein
VFNKGGVFCTFGLFTIFMCWNFASLEDISFVGDYLYSAFLENSMLSLSLVLEARMEQLVSFCPAFL